MLDALNKFQPDYQFDVEVIDVDADEKLLAQYDESVPVLFGKHSRDSTWTRLCHHFFDVHLVTGFLQQR